MPKAIVWVRVNEVRQREEITRQYCWLNIVRWIDTFLSLALHPQRAHPYCVWEVIAQIGVGSDWDGGGGTPLSDLIGYSVMLIRVYICSLGPWVLIHSIQLHHHLASWTGCLFGLEGSVKRWWPVFICGAKYFLPKKLIPWFHFEKKT